MPVATCPGREELIDYVVGKLSDEASDGLASHIDACPQCQAELASLPDPDDTLIARLRGTAPSDPFQDEPGCDRAVARALAVGESNGSAADLPRQLGEYQLLQRLGSGGMGTVYKARQGRLDRVVALKILSRGRTDDPRAIVRFEREMKAIGRLDHPNIVRAYDAREIDGTPVLIMEFVDGLDLAEIVRRANNLPSPSGRGAGGEGGATSASPASEHLSPAKAGTPAPELVRGGLPVADACELVRRTALALQCAHDHGLVHRDIKPSNIMLARSGEVKLLDLGLARFFAENGADVASASLIEETTGAGQAMGTADYMAPEQASDSRTVDIRADIYSLGCTLYKLLSGRAPFSGPEYCATLDKMNAHVQQSPRPVRQIVPDVPEQLAKVLDRMLAKDPSARFTTPAEVAEAVVPFCAGADLPALLNRAETSGVEGSAASESNNLPSPSGRGAGGEGRRWKRFAGQIVALATVGGLCFALGILITIKKNGQTYQIDAPENSRTVVDKNGNATVDIGGSRDAGPTPAVGPAPVVVNPAVEMSALLGRWKALRVEKGSAADKAWQPYDKDFLVAGVQFEFKDPGNRAYRIGSRSARGRGVVRPSRPILAIHKFGEGTPHSSDVWDVSVGSSAAPKWIDLYSGGELFALGVYEIDGKRLRLCLVRNLSPGTERPKRFAVDPASGGVLLELERYQPSADESKLLEPGVGQLDARWNLHEVATNGKPIPIGSYSLTMVFREYDCFVSSSNSDQRAALHDFLDNSSGSNSAPIRMWEYVLDPASQPKKITFVEAAPTGKNELFGIYKFEGDKLTIAYHNGAPRPEKFESAAGSGVTLMVLEHRSAGSPSGGGGFGGFGGAPSTPPTVRVTQPVVCNVCDYEEYSGRIEPGVVRIPLPGTGNFKKTPFKNGETVREGNVLGEFVPNPYDDPKVQLARDARNTAFEAIREARSSNDAKRVAKAEAEHKAAEDDLQRAIRNGPRITIRAPISGTLGNPFRFGGGNDDELPFTTITSPDSMLVSFDVPESTVLSHRRLPNRKPNWELSLPVFCALADDNGFPYRGKVVSVAEGIDPKTHTQRWQAVVPNKDGLFMPGMSVRVRLVTSAPHKVMLIPDRIVLVDRDDKFVFILNDRTELEKRSLKLGREFDGLVVVQDGLNAGNWVDTRDYLINFAGFPAGTKVKPEKFTTPPPPWASVDLTPPAAPPAVSVVHPIVRDVTDYQQFRGIIVAARLAEIRARVTGNLLKVHVKPGMAVKQGDLLFEIDPRLYQSELDQAASAVKEAQVRLDQRTKELKRFEQLLKNAAVSQDEYDRVKGQCEEAGAALKTAEAALKTAQLRLDFTDVTAPFAGKITGGLLDEGNLVTADVTQLTRISSTDPVILEFMIPATVLAKIRGNSHGGPDPALSLPVFCRLTGDKGYDYRAKMDSIESRVEAGGFVMCRAVLANKEDRLAPGMTVDVRVAIGGPHKALLVPERSLGSDVDGRFVFVVNDRNGMERRVVEIGGSHDDGLRVITKGVTAEDWVVTSGLIQVRPGTTVTPEKTETQAK